MLESISKKPKDQEYNSSLSGIRTRIIHIRLRSWASLRLPSAPQTIPYKRTEGPQSMVPQ